MIMRTATLMRKLEADLRAAFPDVEFTLTVPEWSMRRGHRRCVEIYWCGDPPDAAIYPITRKYKNLGVSLLVLGHVPCNRCGEPTIRSHDADFAFCVKCEPDLWGCGGDEAHARAVQRLKAEATAD